MVRNMVDVRVIWVRFLARLPQLRKENKMLDMFSDKLRSIRPFLNWIDNAKWWHFWNPGSGLKGGLFCGFIAFILLSIFI